MVKQHTDTVKSIDITGNKITYRNVSSYHMVFHSHDGVQIFIPLNNANFEIMWELAVSNQNHWGREIFVLYHLCLGMKSAGLIVRILLIFIFKEADVFSVQIGVRDPFVFHLGQSIKQMVMLEKTDNDKYYDAVITMLANYLVNNYLIQEEQAIAFDSFEKLPCEKLRSAILFMSNNINRNLRIQEIAAEINASQYHFIRVFKEKMGISPNKYHMIQRIEKAKKLLIRQDKIIDVANNLGFSSQSHFSSVFTKTVGITPLKFQQQY